MGTQSKVGLMLSGGLDSYIAYYYAKEQGYDVLPIVVDLGHPYHHKELEAIKRFEFESEVRYITCDILKPRWNNLPTKEDWIIPARNLLLATIGAVYADRIWICALEGELHRQVYNADKTPEFYLMASGILTFVCGMKREKTIVETPFEHMTKADVIRWALDYGLVVDKLKNTNTCYDERAHNCGQCSTCFKRNVAMTLNGITEDYETNPWLSKEGKRIATETFMAIDKSDFSHYSPKRVYETIKAMQLANEYQKARDANAGKIHRFLAWFEQGNKITPQK